MYGESRCEDNGEFDTPASCERTLFDAEAEPQTIRYEGLAKRKRLNVKTIADFAAAAVQVSEAATKVGKELVVSERVVSVWNRVFNGFQLVVCQGCVRTRA